MTDEQIVEAAKSAGKKTEFGKLVRSKVSRGVNSAYGIGFLEGAEWARWQMMKEAVETHVSTNGIGNKYLFPNYNDDFKDINDGDKVRIIIVKED